jgi:5-methylcytosine-specific restriction endonuclease McrA
MTEAVRPQVARPPTPDEQVRFLRMLQRLLDEGNFVASYKYALLHAIADLCVTLGDDSGAALTLSTRDLADRFVELYWRQAAPYPAGDRSGVLKQNTGRQAAVVRHLRETRARYGGKLIELKRMPEEWDPLVRDVDSVVRKMPLWRLQTCGTEQVEFLYENVGRGTRITLKPGVAYCFRAFYSLILDMVEGAWSHYVRRQNLELLGDAAELRAFLFGSERAPLARYRALLDEAQEGRCLYCRERLDSRRRLAVDHFIPWRRYPTDLGHNLVLAHERCNARKRDHLAAEPHLARWGERNEGRDDLLTAGFRDLGVAFDLGASRRIAHWAYRQVATAEGQVWVEGAVLRPLGAGWEQALVGGSVHAP